MSERKILGRIALSDGTRKDVLDENARFWICKGAQFRKSKYELIPVPEKKEKKTEEEKEEKKDAV